MVPAYCHERASQRGDSGQIDVPGDEFGEVCGVGVTFRRRDEWEVSLTTLRRLDEATFDERRQVGDRVTSANYDPRIAKKSFLLLLEAPSTSLQRQPVVANGVECLARSIVAAGGAAQSAGEAKLDTPIIGGDDPLRREGWDRTRLEPCPSDLHGLDGGGSEKDGLPSICGVVVSQNSEDRISEAMLGLNESRGCVFVAG
jgi:hypothetical protein